MLDMELTSDRIGIRFRLTREQRGLTREKVAARADVSVSTVARLENNDALPSTHTLIRLANVLGVTAGALLDGDAAHSSTETGADVDNPASASLSSISPAASSAAEQ